MFSRRTLITAGGGVLLAARAGNASQVLALDLSQITDQAPVIVVASVVSVSSDWEQGRKRILTTVTLDVEESWKGTISPRKQIQIVQPGGSAGDIEMKVHGMPRFVVGQRVLLFLRPRFAKTDPTPITPGDPLAVVGMAQGKRELFRNEKKGPRMVRQVDRAAAVVRAPDGRLTPAPSGAHAISLNQMRSQVRDLVSEKLK